MPEPDITVDGWLDVYHNPATEIGWYATTHIWDIREGIFPSAMYWNGQRWSKEWPITQRSPQTFADQALAQAWAVAHDPERLT